MPDASVLALDDTELRSMSLLTNKDWGDATLTWKKKADEGMREVIQKLMDQGIVFFVIKKGSVKGKKTKLKALSELGKSMAIGVNNEDLQKLVESGVEFGEITGEIIKVRTATSAKDAAENQTVGVRQPIGG